MHTALRTASASDLAAVGRIYRLARGAAYAGLVPAGALAAATAEVMDEWWVQRWTWERDYRMTVAERDGEVAGFSYAGPHDLDALYVDPASWGTGVGRALLARATEDLGGGPATLYVLAANARARRFYERAGWRADGTRRSTSVGGAELTEVRYGLPGRRERVTE